MMSLMYLWFMVRDLAGGGGGGDGQLSSHLLFHLLLLLLLLQVVVVLFLLHEGIRFRPDGQPCLSGVRLVLGVELLQLVDVPVNS